MYIYSTSVYWMKCIFFPQNITLPISRPSVVENQANALIGILTTNDVDQLEKFTYSLEINPSGKFKVSSIMSYFTCLYFMLTCEHGLDPYCTSVEFFKCYSTESSFEFLMILKN